MACPQPRARELPVGRFARRLKRSIVLSAKSPETTGQRIACAKRRMSPALPNNPAWPLAPPSTKQFSSCTSPWITRWRKTRSSSVGGILSFQSSAGRKKGGLHFQRRKDLARAERVDFFSCNPFENATKQDETDIRIFSPGTRLSFKWHGYASLPQLFSFGAGCKKPCIACESRTMGKADDEGSQRSGLDCYAGSLGAIE